MFIPKINFNLINFHVQVSSIFFAKLRNFTGTDVLVPVFFNLLAASVAVTNKTQNLRIHNDILRQ